MLLEVSLTNWKPFEITDPPAQFTPGINFIYGENGAGKSSFLEAIQYGLYGELPYNLLHAVRRGKTYSRVKIRFSGIDGNIYSVERTIRVRASRDGSRSASTSAADTKLIYPDGSAITRASDVTKEVVDKLGVPARLFSETIYLRQGELRDIIIKTGRDRAKYLDGLIGTLDLETCYRNCAELEKWSDSQIRELEGAQKSLKPDVSKLPNTRRAAEELKARKAGLSKGIQALEKTEGILSKEKQTLETAKSNLDKANADLRVEEANKRTIHEGLRTQETLLSQVEESEKRVEEISQQIREADQLEAQRIAQRSRYDSLMKGFIDPDTLRNQIKRLRLDISRRQRGIVRLKETKKSLTEAEEGAKSLPQADKEFAAQNKTYLETRDSLTALSTELKRLESSMTSLENYEGGQCPTCFQEIRPEYYQKVAEELRLRVTEGGKDLKTRRALLMQLEESVKELQDKREQLRDLASKIDGLRSEVERLDEELEELRSMESNLTDLASQLRGADSRAQEIRAASAVLQGLIGKLGELRALKSELPKLEKTIAQRSIILVKIAELKAREAESDSECNRIRELVTGYSAETDNERLVELTSKLEETELRLHDAEGEERELRGLLVKTEESIGELEKKESELQQVSISLEKWSRTSSIVSTVRQAFRGAQPILRQQFLDSINVEAQQIFMDIRRKRRLEGIEVTSDYEINIQEAGEKHPVEFYSGGEKTLIALVLRTALVKALVGEIPLLMYDEPTEYLDRGHRENLVNWLSEWGEIPQVIVVSQLEEFNTVADNFKEIQMREDGSSIVI